MLGTYSARALDERTPTTMGPSTWPVANEVVIAAIKRGAARLLHAGHCQDHEGPADGDRRNDQHAGVGRDHRGDDTGRHDDLADRQHTARLDFAHQRRDKGRRCRGQTEQRPSPAEDRGVGDLLSCQRRQKRRRNDVSETKDAVASDEPPGIGGEPVGAQRGVGSGRGTRCGETGPGQRQDQGGCRAHQQPSAAGTRSPHGDNEDHEAGEHDADAHPGEHPPRPV